MGYVRLAHPHIGQGEHEHTLQKNWYSDHANHQWLLQNSFCLKAEQQHDGSQKPQYGIGLQMVQKSRQPLLPLRQKLFAGEISSKDGGDDIQADRKQQCFPWYRNIRHPQKH